MSRDEALREAKRRWGYNGSAWVAGGRCCVANHYVQWNVVGYGETWEAALVNANHVKETKQFSSATAQERG